MALTFRDISWTPPQGWTFIDPHTQHQHRASSFQQLLDNIRRYRRMNNLPTEASMEQQVIDAICARIPTQCREAHAPSLTQLAQTFAGSMVAWVKQGAPVLTWEQMMSRRDVCTGSVEKGTSACPQWHGDAGFHMGRCGQCGCLSLKLFLATEKCPLGKWDEVKDETKLFKG